MRGETGCCGPRREGSCAPPVVPPAAPPVAEPGKHLRNCVAVPGGVALLGTMRPMIEGDVEGPAIHKRVKDLWWEAGAISVGQFRRFVAATGHVTVAERLGWSFVFHSHVPGGVKGTLGVAGLEWWRRIDGADWAHPTGPEGEAPAEDLPVTHVAWQDARAFASWAGGRLPREVEWEHAARGGQGDVPFPWGDRQPDDASYFPCNIWQGRFPHENLGRDGYLFTAPAKAFAPNGYGLFNMVGNVWEWTAEPFVVRSLRRSAQAFGKSRRGCRLLKGGSHLCHVSYCFRYRIAARSSNTPDSTTTHQGFRVVWDIQRSA